MQLDIVAKNVDAVRENVVAIASDVQEIRKVRADGSSLSPGKMLIVLRQAVTAEPSIQ